ncbi:25S rRNA (adenine-N(1))-methyltransferase [Fusarium oxysporum]|uniref:Ribosomal RNA-processing protein 8 n=1 Tax=Fusarium oxysporum TaxID=5507 RepID=A0A420RFB0_FUSOX|nr:25S rRNA (adenine-N(1))-methyltransferase [Fusarium oxysporum]RKL15716.1 25S rRNA (adenine-N(1))-methyltransferase [Fusarium oxysporum]
MFAVPGWSVSADGLKSEAPGKNNSNSAPGKKSNKRKRNNNNNNAAENVTPSTVADLWESVIEGKKTEQPKSEKAAKRQKKQKKAKDGEDEKLKEGEETKEDKKEGDDDDEQPKPKKEKKDKKQKQKQKSTEDSTETNTSPAKDVVAKTAPQPPAPPKLTPLQASMREKLISARFRHLNETLYTRPSEEAFNLFDESPEMFDEYHEGFRRQVKVWPENPVDSFLKDIRARGKVRQQGKGRPGAPPTPLAKTPLPRTQQECTIADLGCGDARLAEALQSDGKKLKVNVKSYDLQSPSPLVTKADIANLPLADGSVNVAVFCLALMGTNWVDFIEEAYRILHWKGELWVAEIKSRFGPIRNKNAPVTHSVGNRKKNAMAGKKGKKGADNDAEHDEDLAVEVDGMDDRRRETDVTAFVEVLRSRGFVLQGDREAIDLSNKMFVKMHFIKGASPTKGKHVKEQEAPKGKRGIIRRIDPIDEQPEFNEASVLKPCVYKIR